MLRGMERIIIHGTELHYILIEDLHLYNWYFSTDEMCHPLEKLKSVMQTHDVWTHGLFKIYKADSWNH